MPGAALVSEPEATAARRGGEGRLDVPRLLEELGGHVGRNVLVDLDLALRRRLQAGDHWQRLVLDLHQVRGILGQVAVLSDHEGDRFARVPDYLGGKAALRAGLGQRRVGDEEREVHVAEGKVGCGVDRVDSGGAPSGLDVDGCDARVRVGGADEAGLESSLAQVVGVAAESPQQPLVLAPAHPLAEPPGGQAVEPSRISSAARWTARRIDA
jgi:hypothetical protein